MKYDVTLNGKVYEIEVERGEAVLVSVDDAPAPAPAAAPVAAPVAAVSAPPAAAPASALSGEVIAAPMPGAIISVKVKPGDAVKQNQVLLILEAMKMENEVMSPRDGTISQVLTSKGAKVETGAPLLTLT